MEQNQIISFLEDNELSDIEVINYQGEGIVLRFFYDFDEDEVKAAKAYANDESEDEENGEVWYEEFFLPYLNDLAVDNVGDIVEEAMEKLNVGCQFVAYDMDEEEYNSSEFIAVFFEKGKELDIETVLDELEL